MATYPILDNTPIDQLEGQTVDSHIINDGVLGSVTLSKDTGDKNESSLFSRPKVDTYFGPRDYIFQSNGLIVSAYETYGEKYNFSGRVVEIPEGSLVGEVDFLPKDEGEYVPSNRSYALATLVRGLQDFFKAVEGEHKKVEDNLDEPEYLRGVTNPRMARFAQRFGFICGVEAYGKVPVLAKTTTVKEKVAELQRMELGGKNMVDVLANRAKLQMSSAA